MRIFLTKYSGLICSPHPPSFNFQFTDEEVERSYEEFYEDVHTEFLKFGEIVNFKVVDCCDVLFWPNIPIKSSHHILGCCVYRLLIKHFDRLLLVIYN
jgi:hypothetical protein